MFGFGNRKKRYLDELSKTLSDLGNIPLTEAQSLVEEYEYWITSETFKRNLDPLSGAINLAEKSMERIVIAHQLKEYDGVQVVPDFMLLVALKGVIILSKAAAQTGVEPLNSFLPLVIELPVNVLNPERTYREVLNELVANDPDVSGKY